MALAVLLLICGPSLPCRSLPRLSFAAPFIVSLWVPAFRFSSLSLSLARSLALCLSVCLSLSVFLSHYGSVLWSVRPFSVLPCTKIRPFSCILFC